MIDLRPFPLKILFFNLCNFYSLIPFLGNYYSDTSTLSALSMVAFCLEVVLDPDFLHANVPATQSRDLS